VRKSRAFSWVFVKLPQEVQPVNPKRILILMSDTGGGHRAAAEAIKEALERRHGTDVLVEMVDVLKQYAPKPFSYLPEFYPFWIKKGKLSWGIWYQISNAKPNANAIMSGFKLIVRRGVKRMLVREQYADAIINVHPLFSTPAMSVLKRQADRPPFITVVTDLVTTHTWWYDRRCDRTLVPTQPALEVGIKHGMKREKMRVTGLPVNPKFADRLVSKPEARASLKWTDGVPTLLMVGGGDGMGPLKDIAQRLDALPYPLQLAIVAGRNEDLRKDLQSVKWKHPVHVYGFVTNMPELMAAADLLVTKAGPGTISEACIAGLPMILSDAIPGQEDGNVQYVVENDAGVFAPGPEKVIAAVQEFLEQGPEKLAKSAENAKRIARPDAVWEIADEVWNLANEPRIKRIRRSIVPNQVALERLISISRDP
jgi:1,2-diacylglycerol 3-beta-galactosyltransferase